MVEWRGVLLVVHIISTMMMAAPFYMLVIVNERVRFGAPLGYYTDCYMENIIRNNAARCFIFQGTILASGLALTYVAGYGWSALVTRPEMIIKVVALLTMVGLLSMVHFYLQPRIEKLMDQVKPGEPVPDGLAPRISRLRLRRKGLSAVCLALVLIALTMGLRATLVSTSILPWD